jgi:hypothetical protein
VRTPCGAPDLGLGIQTGRDKELNRILEQGKKGYGQDKGEGSHTGAVIGWIVGGPLGSIIGSAIGGANDGAKDGAKEGSVKEALPYVDEVLKQTSESVDRSVKGFFDNSEKPSTYSDLKHDDSGTKHPSKDNTPNPDDPRGGGGHNMPNPEGTGGAGPRSSVFMPADDGTGPVGPRSNVGAASRMSSTAHVFMPADDGTGPAGPRSNVARVSQVATHTGLAGHDLMPNPDGVGGNGPNSRGA